MLRRMPDWRLLIIPIAIMLLATWVRDFVTPLYALHHDPDYAYLFNGFDIANLVAPHHIDHPGTPVQMLVALMLRVMHPLASTEEMFTLLVQQPEKYLLIASHLLVLIVAASIFVAGMAVHRLTGSITMALITQAPPLVFGTLAYVQPRVHPEPMVIAVTMLCIAILARFVWRPGAAEDPANARSVGLIAGVGVAAKLTFAPVLFVPLMALSWRLRMRYLMYVLLGFFLATFPLMFKTPLFRLYRNMFSWIQNLFLGSGIYGEGPRTVVKLDLFVANLKDMLTAQAPYLLIIALAMVVLLVAWWRRRSGIEPGNPPMLRLLFGLIVTHVVMLLLYAKHYQSDRYLAATLTLSGFTLAIVYDYLKHAFAWNASARRGAIALICFMAVLVGGMSWGQLKDKRDINEERRARLMKEQQLVSEKYQRCRQVHQDSQTPEFALFFGMQWSRKNADIDAAREAYFKDKPFFTYDPGHRRYLSVSEEIVDLDRIKRGAQCVIMRTPQGIKVL